MRLLTLGTLRLDRDGEALLPGRRKELALLAHLARRARRDVARDELADLFWGERDSARARHSLRQALLRLRQALGPDAIDVDGAGDRVSLRAGVVVLDAAEFERDVADGRHADAVARWGGEFLPGAEDAGAGAFHAWLEQERESLRRQLAVAFRRLTTDAGGDATAALSWAERWMEALPYDEDAMLACVGALQRLGRAGEARARSQACVRRLRDSLGVEPSRELARAATTPASPMPAFVSVPATAAKPEPPPAAIVVVEGEAGATRASRCAELLRERRALRDRAVVLAARGDRATQATPWSTACTLLAGLASAPGLPDASNRALGELASLVPALRERFPHVAAASGEPDAVAEALQNVLRAVAARAAVLVFVDDVAHADTASQRLIASLVQRPPPASFVLLAGRAEELRAGPLAAALADSPDARREVVDAPAPPAHRLTDRVVRRRLATGLAVAAVLVLALALPRVRPGRAAAVARPAPAPPTPKRVLVTPFGNESGDASLDPLGRIGAEWLADGLAKTGLARVVPLAFLAPPLVSDSSAAGARQSGPAREREEAREQARTAQADLVVSGSYARYGDTLRFVARVTDVRSGELLTVVDAVAGDVRVPMAVVESLRRRMLGALAPHLDARLAAWAGAQSVPPSYDAYVEFARGLTRLAARRSDALDNFLAAYRLDTTYTLPLLYAAGLCASTSCFWTGDSLVRTLLPRRDRLAPFDRHLLDFYVARFRGDWNAQLAVAREGLEIAPTAVTLVHGAAVAAVSLNRPAEAAEVIESLDLDGPLDLAPTGVWNYAAAAAHMLGDYERQLDIGRTVRRRAPADVRYLVYEARALAAMGRLRELDEVLGESLQLPEVAGQGLPSVWVHISAHDELLAHGQSRAAARALLERLLGFYRDASPALRGQATYQLDIAHVLQRLGRLDAARAAYERVLAEHPRGWNGADGEHEAMLMWIGVVAARQGDRARVAEVQRELRADGSRSSEFGQRTEFLGFIAAGLGERAEAVRLLKRAAAEGRRFDSYKHAQSELSTLRGYAPFDEWVRPKG